MSGGNAASAGWATKYWSNRQGTMALLSGEAEHCGSVKAAAELMELRSLAKDLEWNFGVQL